MKSAHTALRTILRQRRAAWLVLFTFISGALLVYAASTPRGVLARKASHRPGALMSCPASLTVNNTGDEADATPGDGVCETATGNGVCTLRAALQEANAQAACSPLTINITVTGAINLTAALPVLTHPN